MMRRRRRSKRESGGKQSNITVPEENGLHVFEHARKNMDKPNVWRGGPWYKKHTAARPNK